MLVLFPEVDRFVLHDLRASCVPLVVDLGVVDR